VISYTPHQTDTQVNERTHPVFIKYRY